MRNCMLQLMLFIWVFASGAINACYDPNEIIELNGSEVFIPKKLGNLKLFRDQQGFHVFKDGNMYDVQNCFCDPADKLTKSLFTMSNYQLKKFVGRDRPKIITLTPEEFIRFKNGDFVEIAENRITKLPGGGYIAVSQTYDGEYILRAEMRLLGGDWWSSIKKTAIVGLVSVGIVGGGVIGAVGLVGVVGAIGTIGTGVTVVNGASGAILALIAVTENAIGTAGASAAVLSALGGGVGDGVLGASAIAFLETAAGMDVIGALGVGTAAGAFGATGAAVGASTVGAVIVTAVSTPQSHNTANPPADTFSTEQIISENGSSSAPPAERVLELKIPESANNYF